MSLLPSTSPTDHKEFKEFSRVLTGEMVITILALGAISVLLFWPADLALYDRDSPLLLGFAKMRFGLLCLIGSAYGCLNLVSRLRSYSISFLGFTIAAAALWVATSLGYASPLSVEPDHRWVYSLYLMPFITLVLVVPIGQRASLTFGYTIMVLAMLGAPDPNLILMQFAGSPTVLLGFSCMMSCGVGHVLYLMIRSAHRQQWALIQRESYLTNVNKRLEDELAQDAQNIVHRLREYDSIPKAVEEDRKRLARDIHDELGQLLSSLRIRVTLAQQHVHSPKAMTSTFGELDQHLELALTAVREIVSNLRSKTEPKLPLTERLQQLTQRFEQLTDCRCSLKIELGTLKLSPEQHEHLTRIIQESLTNIMRHAQASQVEIIVGVGSAGLEIAIRDNGLGFDTTTAKAKGHHGLLSLEERAEILGATLSIRSGVDAGTTVSLRLPKG